MQGGTTDKQHTDMTRTKMTTDEQEAFMAAMRRERLTLEDIDEYEKRNRPTFALNMYVAGFGFADTQEQKELYDTLRAAWAWGTDGKGRVV